MWRRRTARHRHPTRVLLLLGPIALAVAAGPLRAQEVPPAWNPEPVPATERRLSLGVEVGKPLVFGFKGGYNFTSRISSHLGFAALGDFTAISGGLRLNLVPFDVGRALPFAEAGFTQYFLADGPRETSPMAAYVLAGLEYVFLSHVGVGLNLGYQTALGSPEDPTVERYGINDDLDEWLFAVNARYFIRHRGQ